MRITKIEAFQVDLPLHEGSYKWSGGKSVEVFDSTVVAVHTDADVTGYGEVCPLGPAYLPAYAKGARTGIAELAPHLIGLDPTALSVLNDQMDRALRGHPYELSRVSSGGVLTEPMAKCKSRSLQDAGLGFASDRKRSAICLPPPEHMCGQRLFQDSPLTAAHKRIHSQDPAERTSASQRNHSLHSSESRRPAGCAPPGETRSVGFAQAPSSAHRMPQVSLRGVSGYGISTANDLWLPRYVLRSNHSICEGRRRAAKLPWDGRTLRLSRRRDFGNVRPRKRLEQQYYRSTDYRRR